MTTTTPLNLSSVTLATDFELALTLGSALGSVVQFPTGGTTDINIGAVTVTALGPMTVDASAASAVTIEGSGGGSISGGSNTIDLKAASSRFLWTVPISADSLTIDGASGFSQATIGGTFNLNNLVFNGSNLNFLSLAGTNTIGNTTLAGGTTDATVSSLTGHVSVAAGTGLVFMNGGTIDADLASSGDLEIGQGYSFTLGGGHSISAAGIVLQAGSSLDVSSGSFGSDVTFALVGGSNTGETLTASAGELVSRSIVNFDIGDVIDLRDVAPSDVTISGSTVSVSGTSGSGSISFTGATDATVAGASFTTQGDGLGGMLLTIIAAAAPVTQTFSSFGGVTSITGASGQDTVDITGSGGSFDLSAISISGIAQIEHTGVTPAIIGLTGYTGASPLGGSLADTALQSVTGSGHDVLSLSGVGVTVDLTHLSQVSGFTQLALVNAGSTLVVNSSDLTGVTSLTGAGIPHNNDTLTLDNGGVVGKVFDLTGLDAFTFDGLRLLSDSVVKVDTTVLDNVETISGVGNNTLELDGDGSTDFSILPTFDLSPLGLNGITKLVRTGTATQNVIVLDNVGIGNLSTIQGGGHDVLAVAARNFSVDISSKNVSGFSEIDLDPFTTLTASASQLAGVTDIEGAGSSLLDVLVNGNADLSAIKNFVSNTAFLEFDATAGSTITLDGNALSNENLISLNVHALNTSIAGFTGVWNPGTDSSPLNGFAVAPLGSGETATYTVNGSGPSSTLTVNYSNPSHTTQSIFFQDNAPNALPAGTVSYDWSFTPGETTSWYLEGDTQILIPTQTLTAGVAKTGHATANFSGGYFAFGSVAFPGGGSSATLVLSNFTYTPAPITLVIDEPTVSGSATPTISLPTLSGDATNVSVSGAGILEVAGTDLGKITALAGSSNNTLSIDGAGFIPLAATGGTGTLLSGFQTLQLGTNQLISITSDGTTSAALPSGLTHISATGVDTIDVAGSVSGNVATIDLRGVHADGPVIIEGNTAVSGGSTVQNFLIDDASLALDLFASTVSGSSVTLSGTGTFTAHQAAALMLHGFTTVTDSGGVYTRQAPDSNGFQTITHLSVTQPLAIIDPGAPPGSTTLAGNFTLPANVTQLALAGSLSSYTINMSGDVITATQPLVLWGSGANLTLTLPTLAVSGAGVTYVGDRGNNTITTGGIADTIYGGSGTDSVTYGAGGGIYVGYTGAATVNGGSASGTSFSDTIHGVTIFAGTGGGQFTAGGNFSVVEGGGGHETLNGGLGLTSAGGQQMIVGAMHDASAQDSIVGNVNGIASATLYAETGIGSTTVTGGGESDVVVGSTGNLSVDGGAGPMTVEASAAASLILAPSTHVNANGASSVVVFDTPSNSTVLHSDLYVVGGSGSLAVYGTDSNQGDMTVVGGIGSTQIVGNGGEDALALGIGGGTIWGGAGEEVLIGGAGGTSLIISAGATAEPDAFVVQAPTGTESTVQIEGFRSGTDILDLRGLNYSFGAVLPTATQVQVMVGSVLETVTQIDLVGHGQSAGKTVHLQLVGGTVSSSDLADSHFFIDFPHEVVILGGVHGAS